MEHAHKDHDGAMRPRARGRHGHMGQGKHHGRRGGRGGGRGRGRARRGAVRIAALMLIAEEPRNGYQIMQEIDARSEGRWKPSSGAIYPSLTQLTDEGLIIQAADGKAFEVTDEGRAMAEQFAEAPAPWELPEDEQDAPQTLLDEALRKLQHAVEAIVQSDDEALAAEATTELDALRRKLYQLLAEH